jgi:enoyl-CoA hydratase
MTCVTELAAASAESLLALTLGSTRIIVLNRPAARNALTREMRRQFPSFIEAADNDASIAVSILTGMDPSFSAGVDLKERTSGRQAPVTPNPAEVLRAARKPIIAAVNGACVTGALEMALSCSFIVASSQARFADTHAKLGMFPRWGQTALLPNAIGARRARQMMLTGEFIGAETALQWGLVNEITAPAELLDRCLLLATQIAGADANSMAAQHRTQKEIMAASLAEGLESERRALQSWDESR